MCGNANIDDTCEHVLEIVLWVSNGCTRVQENSTGRKHDVMTSVLTSTNMCGNAKTDDACEHVLEIVLWVINGCTRVQDNSTGGNIVSRQVCQNPPTCVVMPRPMTHVNMFWK